MPEVLNFLEFKVGLCYTEKKAAAGTDGCLRQPFSMCD